ncbi:transposase [Xanthomonas translucens]|uniref:transposase n=1 Tax=Xanthomonas campestris pv. translucens TaxID=343 RepID=UPI000D342687
MSSKRYTQEFKVEAVKQVTERGHSVADVASLDRPAFRRHPVAIIDGNDRGVYGQQQAVHG